MQFFFYQICSLARKVNYVDMQDNYVDKHVNCKKKNNLGTLDISHMASNMVDLTK